MPVGDVPANGTLTVNKADTLTVGATDVTEAYDGGTHMVTPIANVTAGTMVTLSSGAVVKAAQLSGQNGLQFWRNSVSGTVEARTRAGTGVELNSVLHTN